MKRVHTNKFAVKKLWTFSRLVTFCYLSSEESREFQHTKERNLFSQMISNGRECMDSFCIDCLNLKSIGRYVDMSVKTFVQNKTVLLRDRKRRTACAPHLQKFPKCLSNFCPKFCPIFVQNFAHFLSKILYNMFVQIYLPPPPSWGGTPGGRPPPPCEQTNWKHYLPVILRMRAVTNTWLSDDKFTDTIAIR